MLLRDGHLLGPFGLMGGNMQPQGHVQLLSGLLDQGLDPQAALDAPRFRLDRDGRDWTLQLEPGLRRHERTLAGRGHRTEIAPDDGRFGGGQAILVQGDALVGGSEPRKDGHAAGF